MEDIDEIGTSSRLEGRNSLKILFKENGKIDRVQLNIDPIHPFEIFAKGRYCEHISRITNRIYGLNAIPHHLAPTKALEDAWNVEIPIAALKLRKLIINAAHFYSNILHFYSIALPNFLKGPFLDPATKNIIRIYQKTPEYFKMASEMIDYGQKLCTAVGGKSITPISAIVGGIKKPLNEITRDYFLKNIDKYIDFTKQSLDICLKFLDDKWDVVNKVGIVPTCHIGLTKNGIHDLYEGDVRIMTIDGNKVDFDIHDYFNNLNIYKSKNLESNYLFYNPAGYPDGIYQSNSLSRINVSDRMATKIAEDALKAFREKINSISNHTYVYPWVEIIEAIESIEIIKDLLEDPDTVNPDCKTLDIEPKEGLGIGACETTRGLLIYRIWSDFEGICEKLDILTPTTQNLASDEKILTKIAQQVFEDKTLGDLNLLSLWNNS